MYGYFADAVVLLHILYVGYVVLGQVAIIAAAPFQARWARNPWFRFAAITIVAIEAIMGWRCPLTVWEEQLRALGGAEVATGASFMGRIITFCSSMVCRKSSSTRCTWRSQYWYSKR